MLVNKDVTSLTLDELEDVLGTFSSPIDYQSNKQPMSLRWTRSKKPQMEWKSDLGHGRWDQLRKLEGFLAKRIGRPFSEVYKEFLNRFDPNLIVGWGSMRERFMDMFVSTRIGGSRDNMNTGRPFPRWRGTYYIDEDLNIQQVKQTPIYKKYTQPRHIELRVNTEWVGDRLDKFQALGAGKLWLALMGDPTEEWLKNTLPTILRTISNRWKETFPKDFLSEFDYRNFNAPVYFGGDPTDHLYNCIVEKYLAPGPAEKPRKQTKAELLAVGALYDAVLKAAKQAAKRAEAERRLNALYGEISGRPL